jgi:GH24 family phage-related lysozyme (muramidase)
MAKWIDPSEYEYRQKSLLRRKLYDSGTVAPDVLLSEVNTEYRYPGRKPEQLARQNLAVDPTADAGPYPNAELNREYFKRNEPVMVSGRELKPDNSNARYVTPDVTVRHQRKGGVSMSPGEEMTNQMMMSRRAELSGYGEDSFVDYMKRVEGLKNPKGEGGRTPFRYESPEGGLDTVGIGHKLTQEEIDEGEVYGYKLDTLTEDQVEDIFKTDMLKYESKLIKTLREDYNTDYFDLPPRKRQMLLDMQFNIGSVKKFNEFTKAVIRGDIDTARKEYKRKYKPKGSNKYEELPRNVDFFNQFLSEDF